MFILYRLGHQEEAPSAVSEAFNVATSVKPVEGLDLTKLSRDDKESSVEYLSAYLNCPTVLDCEDEELAILQ